MSVVFYGFYGLILVDGKLISGLMLSMVLFFDQVVVDVFNYVLML